MMELTKEKVLAMEAGREMDALVAERVMGWSYGYSDQFKTVAWRYPLGERTWFPASNDISAAWEVADKLKIAIIPQSPSAPDELKYLARAEWDFKQLEIDVFAETAPLAICRVALLTTLSE